MDWLDRRPARPHEPRKDLGTKGWVLKPVKTDALIAAMKKLTA
ncbi:MAG TPA: hypothetical protein VEK07_09180 [Polyangiaceae bacterium]|nr:hypothetical protein [Polyangiaceae bacterium]